MIRAERKEEAREELRSMQHSLDRCIRQYVSLRQVDAAMGLVNPCQMIRVRDEIAELRRSVSWLTNALEG